MFCFGLLVYVCLSLIHMVDVHIAVELQEAPAWCRGYGAMFVTAAADKLGARGDQEGPWGVLSGGAGVRVCRSREPVLGRA